MTASHGRGLHFITESRGAEVRELYTDTGLVARTLYERVGKSTIEVNLANLQTPIGTFIPEVGDRQLVRIRLHEYQRRFGSPSPEHLPDQAGLAALGEAMTANNELDSAQSNIPVGYTYLGQFIAHDLTFMNEPEFGDEPKSARTPALDLDSIYDAPINQGDEVGIPPKGHMMAVGATNVGRPDDLPRAADGKAVIGDIRNDDNLPLAQTHVALLKFHNAVAAMLENREPGFSEKRLKRIVRQHFQSVVLHDYLKRIIDPCTYSDVLENGRSIIYPIDQPPPSPDTFKLPIEFAAAAFRFGHSMIRHAYDLWNGHDTGNLIVFWNLTHSSTVEPIIQLADNWANRWDRLISFEGTPHEGYQTTPPLMASPINSCISHHLRQIPDVALPKPENSPSQISNNLAARTLLRGHRLGLMHAEGIIDEINATLNHRSKPIEPLTDSELVEGEHSWVDYAFQRRFGYDHQIRSRTPLWFYILKEAGGPKGSGGNHLGPLGSRIVMETLHAAIQFSADSIMDSGQKVNWHCDEALKAGAPPEFKFQDLISVSLR